MQTYYKVEKMDGYYRIGSSEGVFCYLLVGTEKALLIDTGYGYGNLRDAVCSVTDQPLYIVNTHGHCDHTGGNGQFSEKIYIHSADVDLCRKHNETHMRCENAERAKHSRNYETGKEYNGLPNDFCVEKYADGNTGELTHITEGHLFILGGATVEVIETPGHTRGGISLLYREKNILFIGDAAGHFVWLFSEETTSRQEYISTLDKMYHLAANAYIGAHNPNVMRCDDFLLYIRAAKEADYKKGQPFESFLGNTFKPRVCALDGKTLQDMFSPGFAAVVISEDK